MAFVFKNELDYGNIIDLAAIIFNVLLVLFITNRLQKKIDNSRAHKDYLINIISEYRSMYNQFYDDLFNDRLDSNDIKHWFKIMTINIEALKDGESNNIFDTLLSEHIKLRNIITNSDDFNNQFNNTHIHISSSLKTSIIKVNKELIRIKHNCVRLINDL